MTTMAGTESTHRPRSLTRVGSLVDKRLRELQEGVLANRSASVALLARLRHAAGKPAGSVPDIWPITLAAEFAQGTSDDAVTAAETAAHLAMTLYAVHQQSVAERMHQRGHGLGGSVRRLHSPDADTDPVRRRFNALGTSDTLAELSHHARGLVQQLRAAKVPLDYGLLADELMAWQRPGGSARVRLQWGREFYAVRDRSAVDAHPDRSTAAEEA